MSDRPPARAWRFYVEDMIAFCGNVLDFTKGFDGASLEKDRMRYDAALRNLELIGQPGSPGRTVVGLAHLPSTRFVDYNNCFIKARSALRCAGSMESSVLGVQETCPTQWQPRTAAGCVTVEG